MHQIRHRSHRSRGHSRPLAQPLRRTRHIMALICQHPRLNLRAGSDVLRLISVQPATQTARSRAEDPTDDRTYRGEERTYPSPDNRTTRSPRKRRDDIKLGVPLILDTLNTRIERLPGGPLLHLGLQPRSHIRKRDTMPLVLT